MTGAARCTSSRGAAGESRLSLFSRECAAVARGEVSKRQRADARANQSQRGMTHGRRHAPNLAVFSFCELEGDPCIRDAFSEANRRIARRHVRRGMEQPGAAWQRAITCEVDSSTGEPRKRSDVRDALDLDPILTAMRVLGIKQQRVEAGFVTQQEQTFGVGIESAEWVHFCGQPILCQRAPARPRLSRELREDAVRLVKGEEQKEMRITSGGLPAGRDKCQLAVIKCQGGRGCRILC